MKKPNWLFSAPTRRIASCLTLTVAMAACNGEATSDDAVVSNDGENASASMSGSVASERDLSLIRMINAAPGAGTLTLRADSAQLVTSVDFQRASEYVTLRDNWVTFEVASSSANSWRTIDTNREALMDGHRYTIVVIPSEDGSAFDTRVVRDEVPSNGEKALVRMVHAARNLDDVSVRRTGTKDDLFDSVDRGDEAGFKAIDPYAGALELLDDKDRVIKRIAKMEFKAGSAYTLVLSRDASGTADLFVVRDTPVANTANPS